MNFLAHLYLSGDQPKVMIGNFIGDFVKGKNFSEHFEADVAKGIELHRMIDVFTDRHEIVQQSKNRLRPKYRHYAGVIVDVFYDHFLARNWSQYHATPLAEFAQYAYSVMDDNLSILPDEVARIVPYMKKDNWLINYGNYYGIAQSLNGMARRTLYHSRMEEAIADLKEFDHAFNDEFQLFFPELKLYAENFLKHHSSAL